MHPSTIVAVLVWTLACSLAWAEENEPGRWFDEQAAPILTRHCLACHSGLDPKGGLDLSRRAGALVGGESGAALAPGKPDDSPLWQRVRDNEMPPEQPLSAEEKTVLQQWIARGAAWGADPLDPFRWTTDQRAGYDWWALQPVQPPTIPKVRHSDWPRNSIDPFILTKLESKELAPSPEAERRTLIRRLSFDLLGLPPTPDEVAAFIADERPDAYERLVGRLLASPHYGVRWGRAWLDLARFGESQGFERDKLRENAWPYRDWVINAWNADLPYDEFIRLQIAGDVLRPDDAQAVIAAGFLVAGPYDEVGQVQQSEIMRAAVRQDDLEDVVSVVGESFLGLTVHCARCHDHKFDPIRQREYYQLVAALDGVRHGERQVTPPEAKERQEQITAEITAVRQRLKELDDALRRRIASVPSASSPDPPPEPLARWTFDHNPRDERGPLHAELRGGAKLESGALVVDGKDGYAATAPLNKDLRAKTLEAWVRLDHPNQRGGGVMSVQTLDGGEFDAIVFGEREPGRWMAGSDFFRRTQSLSGESETKAHQRVVHIALVYHEDGTVAAYREGKPYGKAYRAAAPKTFAAGKAQVVFGLRHSPPGGNRMLQGVVAAAQLYDRALTAEEIARSAAAGESATKDKLLAAMTAAEKAQHREWTERLAHLAAEQERLEPQTVYTVAPKAPGVSHLLLRGNPATPGEAVAPAGIASLVGMTADFSLPANAADAPRRTHLAAWIANPRNPLTARVMVNRLWHFHFGAGLVNTPSDFGFNGGRPTHPELLDHLAHELVRGGWSVKHVQRMIVTSAAYRQASHAEPSKNTPHSTFRIPHLIDADNRLLWRKNPRRLEAEMLRDAILAVAGELNQALGGPGYRDFTTYVHNTQFYEMQDPVGPEYNRRSVYRTWVRSGRSRFLDAFDCPDPSTKTPARASTVTPLQALSLMNNSFVLRMSDRMAERLRRAAGDEAARIDLAYWLVYARPPGADETATVLPFVREHGLAELCRVLLNSNEFLYVE